MRRFPFRSGLFFINLVALIIAGCTDTETDTAADDTSIDSELLEACEAFYEQDASHAGFTITPPTQKYVMAFHTCNTGAADCSDPSEHSVRLAQSDDGASWAEAPGWQPYAGSVPDVMRDDDTLYVVANGLSKVNLNTGEVTAHPLLVLDENNENAMARDIAFAGALDDGRNVVVYVPSMQAVEESGEESILLAVEVAGSEGTCYSYHKTLIEDSAIDFGSASDPDIFYDGTQYILYVSTGQNVRAFVSDSLDGTYDADSDYWLTQGAGGVPSAVVDDGGQVMSYVNSDTFTGSIYDGGIEIKRAVHAPNASSLSTTDFTAVITGADFSAQTAESPGVIRNEP